MTSRAGEIVGWRPGLVVLVGASLACDCQPASPGGRGRRLAKAGAMA
jgi:hypothetical protein